MLLVWCLCALIGIVSFEQAVAATSESDVPEIYYLHITSDIRMRFATTRVVSRMANHKNYSTEATFHVILPNEAFISNFTVEIDGVQYPGQVKEKAQAKKDFERAKKRGHSAGHVSQKPRDTNTFKVSINVAALSKVTFELRYQELLRRRLGSYEHVVYVNPGQTVRDMKIEVFLTESQEIIYFAVPPLRTDNLGVIVNNSATNPDAKWTRPTPKTATVVYKPANNSQIISGAFVVEYDVDRQPGNGEILAVNGYFVHFYAPKGFEALPKDIIFILDTSGSMGYNKITQLKAAMLEILKDLSEGDRFNILRFSSSITRWKPKMQMYRKKILLNALSWVENLRAAGGTNINDALVEGIAMLKESQSPEFGARAGIVVFLTDGEATSGVTNKPMILSNIQRANKGEFPIFGLSFGADADFKLLQKMSLQNSAVARRIYEASDASLQLKDFYDEISAALIADLKFNYLSTEVVNDSLTNNEFHRYFNGTEMIVAGKLTADDLSRLTTSIGGTTHSGSLSSSETVQSEDTAILGEGAGLLSDEDIQNMPEKLWAYLTIKQLDAKRLSTLNETEKAELTEKMLELSLKYKFVTAVTSMVVIKPEDEEEKSQTTTPAPTTTTTPRPIRHATSSPYGSNRGGGGGGGGGASGDPHFLVDINGINVCFDVLGKKGDFFDLISDPVRKIYVRAKIVEGLRHYRDHKYFKTYMGRIMISVPGVVFNITPDQILINGQSLSWTNETNLKTKPARVIINGRGRDLLIEMGLGRHLHIRRSLARGNGTIDFLDFFVTSGKGFSHETSGIIGQFLHASSYIKLQHRNLKRLIHGRTLLTLKRRKYERRTILVQMNTRRDIYGSDVHCWMIHDGISALAASKFFTKKPVHK